MEERSIPILWGVVIVLLVLNLALLYGLNTARLAAVEALTQLETTLDDLANEVIVYDIEVNQAVPIKAAVPFNQKLEVPLNTVIPIDQVLTVPFGNAEIDMPVKANFPINMVVPVDFNQTINVDTVVELNTTVPVKIEIAQTSLAGFMQQARADVTQLKNRLTFQSETSASGETLLLPQPENAGEANMTLANDSEKQVISTETPSPTLEKVQTLDTPELIQPSDSIASEIPFDHATPLTNLGLCHHEYWPLQIGAVWTYNSLDTSYIQQVNEVANNQAFLNTQYEGRTINFSLNCLTEGLGGNYLGDMRRLTAFGDLKFSNVQGVFLPETEIMQQFEHFWVQESEVAGTVEGRYENNTVSGNISRGQVIATYTPTNFEKVQTPLGPREALRIEQKLDIELNIEFQLGDQTIPVVRTVALTTIYWFAQGLGPVKIHWQGGTMQQKFQREDIPTSTAFSVPALAEEYLVSVCILSDDNNPECRQIADISEADLTASAAVELDIPDFVFLTGSEGEGGTAIAQDSDNPEELLIDITEPSQLPSETPSAEGGDQDNSALQEYVEALRSLAAIVNEAAEDFAEAIQGYRDDKLTLEEFKAEFSSFASEVNGPIGEIINLSPPPEAEEIHQTFSDGLEQCDEAIGLMDHWFDTQDDGTKEATIVLVASCLDQIEEAQNELEALVAKN